MASVAHRSTYVPHIDGLRAVAVLAVIVYHLDERWLPGGFAGVDVFFAISGFVVSASVAEFKNLSVPRFFAHFYARRIQRIVPALLVCLVATAFLAMLFVPSAWISRTNDRTGLYAFFGLSNLVLWQTHNDYFSPDVDFNPYTHTWSLGVEEQFYLIFPPLFAAWMLGGRARQASTALFAAGFALSLGAAVWFARSDATFAFYMLPTRFWELAAGVLLYQLLAYRGHPFAEHGRAPTLASSACAALSVIAIVAGFVVSKPGAFPFPGALLPVAGTIGLIASLHGREPRGVIVRALGSRAAVFVGRISYSLYLWHWPVFVLFRWTCGLESPLEMAAAVALTFALATSSFYLVERPARYAPPLRRLPRPALIALGLALVGSSAWLSTRIAAAGPWYSLSTVTRHHDDWYPDNGSAGTADPSCRLGVGVEPVGKSTAVVLTRIGCERAPISSASVFVIGDSHAGAYLSMLKDFALETGLETRLYANGGCPYLSLQKPREGGACLAHTQAALADIAGRAKAGDVLFLPSLRLARFSNQFAAANEAGGWRTMFGPGPDAMRAGAEKEAVAQLTPLARKGLRIVLEAPKPIFLAPPFRCADWFSADNPICGPGTTMPRSRLEAYRKPVMDAYGVIAKQVPGVSVWDPFPVLCPGETCTATRDGRPLFFDGDHVSGYGNRVLFPHFDAYMRRLVEPPAEASSLAGRP